MRSGLPLLQALLVAASLLATQWLSVAPCQTEKAAMACCASAGSCCCPSKIPDKAPGSPKRSPCDCTSPATPEPIKALMPATLDISIETPVVLASCQAIFCTERLGFSAPIDAPPSTGPPLYLRHCSFLI